MRLGPISALVGVALFASNANAQEPFRPSLDPDKAIHHYVHERWTTRDGLPSNTIRDIVQTRDGYLWLATHRGLVRFDGVRFTTFDASDTPMFGSAIVVRLIEARDGTLWIGTQGSGLIRLQHGEFSKVGVDEGLAATTVLDLLEDPDGTVWIVAGGEVHRFDKDGLSRLDRPVDDYPGWINSVTLAPDGTLWFTTRGRGMLRWRQGQWGRLTMDDGLPTAALRFARAGRDGDLWIATRPPSTTVYEYRDGTFTPHNDTVGEATRGRPRSFLASRDGTKWLGTSSGLARLSGEVVELHRPTRPMNDDRTLALFEDASGSLWTGTFSGGLHRFSEGAITTLTTPTDTEDLQTQAVFEDSRGTLWVGKRDGLFFFDDGRLTRSAGPFTVRSIDESPDGDLWLGGTDGVRRYSNGLTSFYETTDTAAVLHWDRTDRLWVGFGAGGAAHFTGRSFESVPELGAQRIRWIHEDSAGVIWLGTHESGILRFANESFSRLTTEHGLSSGATSSVHEDTDGVLWVGTAGGGLNRLHEGSIRSYSSADGLHDDSIWPILEDDSHNLWMGGDRGIFRVSKRDLADFDAGRVETIATYVLGLGDGLTSLEINGLGDPSGQKARDGRLWFITADGPAVFDPSEVEVTLPAPNAKVEALMSSNDEPAVVDVLAVPALTQEIRLLYTALSLQRSETIQFQYTLDDYDDGWRDAGTARIAHYTQVPPGPWTFRVRSRYPHGEWGQTDTFEFVILAAWWQTWWARASGLGLGLGVLVGLYRFRVGALARKKAELDHLVEGRTHALDALQSSEAFNVATLDSLPSPIAVIDSRGAILRVNESWRSLGSANGASPDVVAGVGWNYLDVCRRATGESAHYASRCLDGLEKLLETRSGMFDMEYPCHSPSEERWFLLRAVPFRARGDGAVLSHIDISERIRSEKQLAQSEEQLRLIADALPMFVALVDRDSRYVFNNRAYEQELGLAPSRIQGRSVRDVMGERAYAAIAHHVEAALSGRKVRFSGEISYPDGTVGRTETMFVPQLDANGETLGFFVVVQDVTERLRSDALIREQRSELARLQRTGALGELTAALSHEVNQPLAAIRTNADAALRFLAHDPPELSEVHSILKDIVRDDQRAGEVVRSLRALVKKEPGERESLDINTLVEETLSLVRSDALIRRVSIETALADALPAVTAVRVQVQQVLLNLIINALDAVALEPEEGREILVETSSYSRDAIVVSVTDSGPGLPDDLKPSDVFKAFETRKEDGLGLGLAVSRTIIDAHGGEIWTDADSSVGARFRFSLPTERSRG